MAYKEFLLCVLVVYFCVDSINGVESDYNAYLESFKLNTRLNKTHRPKPKKSSNERNNEQNNGGFNSQTQLQNLGTGFPGTQPQQQPLGLLPQPPLVGTQQHRFGDQQQPPSLQSRFGEEQQPGFEVQQQHAPGSQQHQQPVLQQQSIGVQGQQIPFGMQQQSAFGVQLRPQSHPGTQQQSQFGVQQQQPQVGGQHQAAAATAYQEPFDYQQNPQQFGVQQHQAQFGVQQHQPKIGVQDQNPPFGVQQQRPQVGDQQRQPPFRVQQQQPPNPPVVIISDAALAVGTHGFPIYASDANKPLHNSGKSGHRRRPGNRRQNRRKNRYRSRSNRDRYNY